MPHAALPIAVFGLSPLATALIAVVIAVELGLLAWALIDLARRKPEEVEGPKLLWLVICLLFQLIGPVIYLAVGRVKPATAEEGGGVPPPAAPGAPPAGVAAAPSAVPVPNVPATAGVRRGHIARAAAALYDSMPQPAPPDGGEAAIELRDVRKQFGEVAALDGLTLSVPEGSVFGFLGPNGAGKTTTLRILGGLARPTAGSVAILGSSVADAGPDGHARIGYLPDVPAFYKWMSAAEYLRFAGSLFGLDGAVLDERVAALLDLAGLTAVATRIGGYSRGMKQRLGVAQALVNAPRLLLLDEPTSALDPIGRREVLDMIAALRGRTTVLFSTHILADVERVCDTVAIIARGRVVAHAGIDELRRRRAGLHRLAIVVDDPGRLEQALAGAAWLKSLERDEDGVVRVSVDDVETAQRELPALIARLGLALRRLEADELSLEDVFVSLVEGGQPGDAVEPWGDRAGEGRRGSR